MSMIFQHMSTIFLDVSVSWDENNRFFILFILKRLPILEIPALLLLLYISSIRREGCEAFMNSMKQISQGEEKSRQI